MRDIEHVVIAGAGAFGTALAVVADKAGRRVTLFARDAAQAEAIAATRENARYLPGVALPGSIAVTADPTSIRRADLVLLAAPAQATRALATMLAENIPPAAPVVATAKGIEQGSRKTQTEIIVEILPTARPAALSGPGFAEEIARGFPTAVTMVAADLDLAHALSAALATDTFRPYASDDLVGVELGGAIKNVLAIAAGIVAGRALGESARAALIARGLAEMMRLGAAFGARAETFMGLSGLGDLVLTATSGHSRNLAFGMALGEGARAADLLAAGMPLAEGAHTATVAAELARRHGVDMPITAAVAAIVAGNIGVDAAIEGLVSRPLKAESA
jgi:glycerol-3-phosphate dehydrogenase (NAD(P)+)